MSLPPTPPRRVARDVEHLIDRMVRNIEHGRFERSLSGLTAVAAAITTAEIYIEHYKASFGNKMMWSPIIVTPPVVCRHRRRLQPQVGEDVVAARPRDLHANGLLGEYYHARGVARRPGGWRFFGYNVPMGRRSWRRG